MMRQSHIATYQNCPRRYKLSFIERLTVIKNQDADNALHLGTAIHRGCETGSAGVMAENYQRNYYVTSDLQENEILKMATFLPKVLEILARYDECRHEVSFDLGYFHGTADFLGKNEAGNWDMYDFKYCSETSRQKYLESPQLHIYRYFLERLGFRIDKLAFVFIPKTGIYQKKTEDLLTFRKRLKQKLSEMAVSVEEVQYDQSKVTEAFEVAIKMLQDNEFQKHPSKLCDWCEFKNLCQEGEILMILPQNERREKTINTTPDMLLYGDSYTGKTTFMDTFPDVLMLNTDGNTDNITSPVIRIADEISVEGRITKRRFAWEILQETLLELEKKDNTFKTIVLDLAEDLYEHCRLYMYDKLGIDHEQDAGFGKGWDMVRTEFLSTMKRFKNCGYQVVFISKASVSEVTRRNGEKVTVIKPNLNEKIANVLSGLVDITARVVADGDDRYISFKTDPYVFGGSRYNFGVDRINLNKDEFLKALTTIQADNCNTQTDSGVTETQTSVPEAQETKKRRSRKAE